MMLKNSYWYFNKALDDETCDKIMTIGKQQQLTKAIVGEHNDTREDLEQRKSRVAWIRDESIIKLLSDFVMEANKNAGWNFNIDSCEPAQFTEYSEGQFYDWHVDNTAEIYNTPEDLTTHNKLRKLSVVVNLTNPNRYEGGSLNFYDYTSPKAEISGIYTNKEFKNKGTIIVFPSFVWHQVTKILKGTRYSLVAWFLGSPWC